MRPLLPAVGLLALLAACGAGAHRGRVAAAPPATDSRAARAAGCYILMRSRGALLQPDGFWEGGVQLTTAPLDAALFATRTPVRYIVRRLTPEPPAYAQRASVLHAGWYPVAPDSVLVWRGDSMTSVVFRLQVRGDTLSGVALNLSDAGPADTTGPVLGWRIGCP